MIKFCRSCKSKKLKRLFSLGNLYYTGKFPTKDEKIPKGELEIILCKKCSLTQLSKNFSLSYMYNSDYGYRSGINETMVNHLKGITNDISKYISLSKGDLVLDIASNDGTLLKSYPKKIKKFGIDPTISKFKSYYKSIDYYVSDFFSYKNYSLKTREKAKVITCISMFYDLTNPNKFLKDIKKTLHAEGIFILEQSDLYKLIKSYAFDTICHEHLEFYSIKSINYLLSNNGFKIIDHSYNDANGGSSRLIIVHDFNKKYDKSKKIDKIITKEDAMGINDGTAFIKMFKKIDFISFKIERLLKKLTLKNKVVHGYGASTKGNTLLQYFGINKYIKFISDRNIEKVGKYTPDHEMLIISETKSRQLKPDFYFVLPWHFGENLVKRERLKFKNKSKFIFPLPKLRIL